MSTNSRKYKSHKASGRRGGAKSDNNIHALCACGRSWSPASNLLIGRGEKNALESARKKTSEYSHKRGTDWQENMENKWFEEQRHPPPDNDTTKKKSLDGSVPVQVLDDRSHQRQQHTTERVAVRPDIVLSPTPSVRNSNNNNTAIECCYRVSVRRQQAMCTGVVVEARKCTRKLTHVYHNNDNISCSWDESTQ